MTKNVMLRIAFLFAVVCFVNTAVPQKVDAQYALKSQTFYRFRVSNSNLGYFLTANYQEGTNSQFIPDGSFDGLFSRCLVPQCDGVTCPSLFAKETLSTHANLG